MSKKSTHACHNIDVYQPLIYHMITRADNILSRAGISDDTLCSKGAEKRNDYRRGDAEPLSDMYHVHARHYLIYDQVSPLMMRFDL
jgi:hypothetical protein